MTTLAGTRTAEMSQLMAGASAMGVALSEAQAGKLLDYLDLLQKWNKAYNLTAVRQRSVNHARGLLQIERLGQVFHRAVLHC